MTTKQDPKGYTLEDWRKFMNGYRDPKTEAENRKLRERWENEDGQEGNNSAPFSPGGESARECGFRKEGGVYAVVPTSSKFGKPVEDFILCKPLPINREEYNLSNIGVKLIDISQPCFLCKGVVTKGVKTCQNCFGTGKETITHIFDIIGQDNYPNVADFIEETRRLGVSRRLELGDTKQYARLSSRSRLFCLHQRAVISNPGDIYKPMKLTELARLNRAGCVKNLPEHKVKGEDNKRYLLQAGLNYPPGCSALYWNVLQEGAELIPETGENEEYNHFAERKLVSGTYRGYALRENVKPVYGLGIFASFPLSRLEVVNPGGEYEEKFTKASFAGVDVIATEC